MDVRLTILTIVNILSIVMSLVAIYRSKNTIDSDIHYIEKIMEYIELEKCIKEEKKVTTKIISYEQAVKDILETLPKGSAKVIDEPIDNTVVIRIQKKCIYGGITMELTLFLENGKTFKFDNVTILNDDGKEIVFNYVSMSTGKTKSATINTEKILGMAVSSKEDSK